MKSFFLLFITITLTFGQESAEWTTLFDGRTLKGWTATSTANWRVEDGTIVVDSGSKGFLLHDDSYENYELTVEFKSAKGTNSGVFLSTKVKPKSLTSDCYELNIAPTDNPFPTGSLVARKKYADAGEDHKWHTFEVRVEGKKVTVKLDGKLVMDYSGDAPSTGKRIGLQKNEGPVAFRNIQVRKLSAKSR